MKKLAGKPPIFRIARNTAGALILLFLALSIFRHFSAAFDAALSISPTALLFSALCSLLAYVISANAWVKLAESEKISSSWLHHAHIWMLSRLGRYIPGKIFPIIIRVGGYTEGNRIKAATATLNEQLVTLACSTAFLALTAFSGVLKTEVNTVLLAFSAFGVLAALGISPLILRRTFNYVAAHRPGIGEYNPPPNKTLLASAFFTLAAMLLHGASLLALVSEFETFTVSDLFPITAYYYAAGIIGMLAFVAPGGLGVREGALAFFLQSVLPPPVAIACSVMIRCVSLSAELIFSGFLYVANHETT